MAKTVQHAQIDVRKFNVYVPSTLVIVSALYVPQIPAVVWAGFPEFCIYFTSWESPRRTCGDLLVCEYGDGLAGRAGFHITEFKHSLKN